jgi:hypothetical protein
MSKNKDECTRASHERSEGGDTPSDDQREEAKEKTGQANRQRDLFRKEMQGRLPLE